MKIMNTIKAVSAALLLTLGMAGNAFAAFQDLELIRVVYQRSGGTVEAATDLGNVNTLLASGGGSFGGGVNAFTVVTGTDFASSNLYVAYFAVDQTNKHLWMSGTGPESIGTLKSSTIAAVASGIYSGYNLIGPAAPATSTVQQSTTNAASYFKKADGTTNFGGFGGAITIGSTNVEVPLASLATQVSVSQNLYYWANYGTSGAGSLVSSGGSPITILTNADGSTTIVTAPPAPQVTAFSAPATSDSPTVAVNFTVSNPSAVAGYLITLSASPPSPTDPAWSPIAPANYTFSAPGSYTLYLWLKDTSNTVSPPFAGAPVTVNGHTLNVVYDPGSNGVGMVYSSPSGIECTNGIAGGCSAPFLSGAAVTLTASSNNWKYLFGGWNGGACAGSANPCQLSLDTDKTETAGFFPNLQARLAVPSPVDYASIQDAYDAAHTGALGVADIKARVYPFMESLAFNYPIAITLDGGMDASYLSSAGYSTVQGLTIAQGSVVINNLIIQ